MIEFFASVFSLVFVFFLVMTIVKAVKKDNRKAKQFGMFMAGAFIISAIFLQLSPEDVDTIESTGEIDSQVIEGEGDDDVIESSTEPIDEEEPLTLEEQVRSSVIEVVGETTNTKKDRIDVMQVDLNYVSLHLNGSENLTSNLTRLGLLKNSGELLEALAVYSELEEFYLFWYLPLVDAYGNEEDGVVMRITMLREELDKINWENFDLDNLPLIADVYWEHPAFNN